jgi:hypothetical protein
MTGAWGLVSTLHTEKTLVVARWLLIWVFRLLSSKLTVKKLIVVMVDCALQSEKLSNQMLQVQENLLW